MSDRRAVSAGHYMMSGVGASSVAGETWRVALGGNRVESMTAAQIAQAFHNGQLNARTPLWPPGATGWQALGNFEQFQTHPAAYGGAAALSQFEEADDDPTRMWTGGELPDYGASHAPDPYLAGQGHALGSEPRPAVQTGTRPVASARPLAPPPAPMPPPSAPRPAPTASLPPSRAASAIPMSIPPVRRSRKNGLMLVAGLVGLVGLGSAVLAARSNLDGSPAEAAASEAAPSATATPEAPAPQPASVEAKPAEVAPAKYEDTPAAAGAVQNDAPAAQGAGEAKAPSPEPVASDDGDDEASSEPAPKAAASARAREREEAPRKSTSRATPKRAATKAKSAALARVERAERAEKAERAERAERAAEKAEKAERAERAEASSEATKAPSSSAVNEAAAAALANSATLASSCRPRGGPSGAGKARVIYSNDGEVQSVEILTAKFRDTLTGSCVRMVFRRAKIPPFKGDPPSFIKTFTIPED